MRLYISPYFLIALLVLALTNPTTEQYSTWVKTEIVNSEQGDPLVRLLAYALGDPILQATTKRQDYLIFSLFSTALDANRSTYVLGIFGKFLPFSPAQVPWQPGTPSQSYPHVIAAADPGTWHPEDGYVWARQPPNGDLRVRWQSGRASEKFRHVVTASEEERWLPEDGYAWDVDPPVPNDLRVHWQAGKPSTKYAHIITASTDGRWLPEDGYYWDINPPTDGQLGVHWSPGQSSRKYPHVLAAAAEGRWLPETGFRWLSNPPPVGDLRVISAATSVDPTRASLSLNQRKAGCSISTGELLCPGPGTGLCWAEGHNPYFDEPPMAIDVGNPGSALYGHGERCSEDPKIASSNLAEIHPERAFLFNSKPVR